MTREEAGEELKKEFEIFKNGIDPIGWENPNEELRKIIEANTMAIQALEQEPRWIPTSERLPEESGDYLIAIADSSYKNGQFFEISWFYPGTHSWSYLNANVIAWMPLPEPYEAESEKV